MRSMTHPSYADLSQSTGDLVCRKCGYDLRGLCSDGNCPECNTPIAASLHGNLLCYSEPHWIGRLLIGVSLLAWSGLLQLLLSIIFSINTYFLRIPIGIAAVSAALGSSAVCLAGAWIVVTPEPNDVSHERRKTLGSILRISLAVWTAYPLLSLARLLGAIHFSRAVGATTWAVSACGGLLGLLIELQFLEHLAMRVPDPKLARTARSLTRWLGIPSGLLMIAHVMSDIFAIQRVRQGFSLEFMCVEPPLRCFVFLFQFIFVGWLFHLRSRLRGEAHLARENWARHLANFPIVP